MRYKTGRVVAIGYELPPVVVTSDELEKRLRPLYEALHFQAGQLEALTGIAERRWWDPGTEMWQGATLAAKKALAKANGIGPRDLGAVIYAGVCRDNFEPATACRVAWELGVGEQAAVFDISNACLGVLNGMLDIANRIELGQIRAGLVVSSESARDIVNIAIDRLNDNPDMDDFRLSLATLTGGSGAVAVLLTDGSFDRKAGHRLLGGVTHSAPEHHSLCRWGIDPERPEQARQYMSTDSVAVLKHGVALGHSTWQSFLHTMRWRPQDIDRVICHQVGSGHTQAILDTLGIDPGTDFTTYEFLGNIGTVSLPVTAAIAEERDVLEPGQKVAFLGIGSGLNCMMLGLEW